MEELIMGRHSLPDEVKVIRGTFRRDRSSSDQPTPEKNIPKPHSGFLSKNARFHYWRLARILNKMKVLSESDVVTLELASIHLANFYEANQKLEEEGKTYTVTSREGSIVHKKRPEWAIRNESYILAAGLLSKFGLTPSDRTKVKVLPEPEPSKRESPEKPWENL